LELHDIDICNSDIESENSPGYICDMPHGFGDTATFLHIRTPIQILIHDVVIDANPGDCAIFLPFHPQWYSGGDNGFSDDWISIGGRSFLEMVRKHGLPTNTLFHPDNTNFVAPLIRKMRRETQEQSTHWHEVVFHTVEELVLLLSRHWHGTEIRNLTVSERSRLEVLWNVRMTVHESLADDWTVAGMAKLADMSPSWFAALYRKSFDISPMEDLIRERLRHAKLLLLNRALTVDLAAKQSGFTSLHYFHRLFRRREGCTPREFVHNSTKLRDKRS